MKRTLLLALFAILLLCGGCRRQADDTPRTVRIESIDRIEMQGLTGADLTLGVLNTTGFKVTLRSGTLTLSGAEGRLAVVQLRSEVELGEGRQAVPVPVRLRLYDALGSLAAWAALKEGRLDGLSVALRAEVRGGIWSKEIVWPSMPLSDFLRTFGIDYRRWIDAWN